MWRQSWAAYAAAKDEHEGAYLAVPDGPTVPADKQSIKGLSYTQAFAIYKVRRWCMCSETKPLALLQRVQAGMHALDSDAAGLHCGAAH